MALGNIWREPRREIMEQLIGVAVLIWMAAAVVNLDIFVIAPLLVKRDDWSFAYVFGGILSIIALGATIFLWNLAHWLGENICDTLAKANRDPRPKQRYR